jgi:hypothetical protein
MATTTTPPLTVEEISHEILARMTDGLGGMSLVEAIDDGAFVVDDQSVAYWIGEAVSLARQGTTTDEDEIEERAPEGYSCAECGVQDATNYLVTVLDHDDIRHTRTEVCIPCAVTVAAASVDKIIAGLTNP